MKNLSVLIITLLKPGLDGMMLNYYFGNQINENSFHCYCDYKNEIKTN